MNHLKHAAIPALIISALSMNAAAESTLSPVVVTASRQPQHIDELLSDVTVIERSEIEQAGTSTLTDLLARQPGIEISANGGPGTASDVRIRGTESKHVLVLLDGQRINSATLGTISWSRIPLADIDHIEILRGPASSLYGSDAIGGVIQLFTRRGSNSPHLFASAALGTYGTRSNQAGVSGDSNGWRYRLGLSDFHTDGFSAIADRGSKAYNPDNDGYELSSTDGSLSYSLNQDHELGISFLSSKGRNKYDSGFSLASARKDYQSQTDVGTVNAYWKAKVTRAWQSTLSFGRSEDLATNYTNGLTSSIIRTHQEQATWQNDLSLPIGNALIAVDTLKQRISGNSTFVMKERAINSLSGGWNNGIGAHSFQINGRHDVNSQFGSRNTGNAAYGYRLASDWRAHVAYGTAFKAPTFNDLYFPFTANVGVGNPNLLPETSRNAEVGLRFDGATQTASLTYFANRIKNLIQWQESPVGSFFYTPFNVGEAKINGWTGDYQVKLGNWNLGANLNLQDPQDAATGKRLNRRAHAFGNVKIGYTQNEWNFGAELQGTGNRWDDVANTQHMGGYTLVNLYASRIVAKDWSIYGRIDNLFDRTYETAKTFGVPGASLTVGVRYDVK